MWTLHVKKLRALFGEIQVTFTSFYSVHVTSLLEILKCVVIDLSSKVRFLVPLFILMVGRLVHLGKTVGPGHRIRIGRSHEAGGRGWNRPCPIDKIARCGDLISSGLDICNGIGSILPLDYTGILGRYQHANPGAWSINGRSGY